MANSKRKGNAFENAICRLFLEWTGVRWKRTVLSGGAWEPGDIKPAYRESKWVIELKNRESWNFHDFWTGTGPIWGWLSKLIKEADGNPSMLILKRNRRPALAVLPAAALPAQLYNDTFCLGPVDAPAPVPKFKSAATIRVGHRSSGEQFCYVVLRLDDLVAHVDGSNLLLS